MEKIRLLVTSDVHSYIYPHKYHDNKDAPLGLARCAGVFRKYRNNNTLILDNGDVLQGSPLSSYYMQLKDRGTHPMSIAMNLAGYDYINLGNHDFNYGQEMLHEHLSHLNMPCITANVCDEEGKPLGCEYVIHTFENGVKIALFGLVTQYIDHWEAPEHLEHLIVKDAYETAVEIVEKIRTNEKVDYIVCLYHGGYERDLTTNEPTEKLTGENEGSKICTIPGLDILLSGHQHRSVSAVVNGVVTTQTAQAGAEVAMVEIDHEKHEITSCLIKADEEPAEDILEALKDVEEGCQKWLDTPVGHCMIDLHVNDEFEARLHKHPLITYLNKVQSEVSEADLSGNALFIGATGFNESVTVRDLVSTYIYPNTIVVKKVTGKVLKEYLEQCADYWILTDGKIEVNPTFIWPKPAHFNYDMVDGVNYTIKVGNPVGSRITELKYQGKDVSDDMEFTLAINNYRATGGGDFDMIAEAPVVREITDDMVDVLIRYISEHPDISCDHQDNIKVII